MSKNKSVSGHKAVIQQTKVYQGIIPPPEAMEHYERVQPGFANRILHLTEQESRHRQKMEKRIVTFSFLTTLFGQLAALVAVLVVCYLCYFAFDKGYSSEATWIAVTVLIGIASVFLYRRKQLKSNNSN
ncbi:MAG: DUF2335 domain-containing protein [Cyclobacteriaceae bacterium]|nr:DUF2335 domain-containing protein [Cyclobacteriaceae bacterium]MCX7637363.1 DUF2335 domain-containing protein [Cyclobacteriaceae bacterium]MDW8330063.1 DUF2335 domain-containing protein [Cyclobacteriaceae bacterium]